MLTKRLLVQCFRIQFPVASPSLEATQLIANSFPNTVELPKRKKNLTTYNTDRKSCLFLIKISNNNYLDAVVRT